MAKRILVVEDEHVIAFTLKEMLEDLGHEMVDLAHSYQEAKRLIKKGIHQLVILDINLGAGANGIDLASECKVHAIPFFYLSSYNDIKTLDRAIKTTPGSYVLKPFMQADIFAAVELSLQKSNTPQKTFSFKNGKDRLKIDQTDILYLKADGVYTELKTMSHKYLLRQSLQSTFEEMDPNLFLRIHRSYVVNLGAIKKILSKGVSVLNGEELPVSRTYKEQLETLF